MSHVADGNSHVVIHTNIILLILSRESSADGDTEVVIPTATVPRFGNSRERGLPKYPSGYPYKHSYANPDP